MTLKNPQFQIFLSLFTMTSVVLIDRVTKIYFLDLLELGESLSVIKNVFHMTLVYNTGIAFGLFKDQGAVFIVIPIIASVFLIYNIMHYSRHDNLSRSYIMAFSLILGGAIGNLIDRMLYGHVVDFIDFRVWPVFNVADCSITIGAVIVVIDCFISARRKKA